MRRRFGGRQAARGCGFGVMLVVRRSLWVRRFRADILADDAIILEIRAAALSPMHAQQSRTYPRLSGLSAVLLFNLAAPRLKDGPGRFVG
jgi:hypothetical protein